MTVPKMNMNQNLINRQMERISQISASIVSRRRFKPEAEKNNVSVTIEMT